LASDVEYLCEKNEVPAMTVFMPWRAQTASIFFFEVREWDAKKTAALPCAAVCPTSKGNKSPR
jgi:hypothetical protein